MEISLSELRPRLKEVIERVKNDEDVIIVERGKPIARITPLDAVLVSIRDQAMKQMQFEQATGKIALERTKAAQRARDEILRGVNKKS
jgi:prevent-host-death family protein